MTDYKERIQSIRQTNQTLEKKVMMSKKESKSKEEIIELFIEHVLNTIEEAQKREEKVTEIYFWIDQKTKKSCFNKKETISIDSEGNCKNRNERCSEIECTELGVTSIKELNNAIISSGTKKEDDLGVGYEYYFLEDFLRVSIFTDNTWICVKVNY